MKAIKYIQILLVCAIIVMLPGLSNAETPISSTKLPTIYALLIIADADPNIGRSVIVDKENIEDLLNKTKSMCNVSVDTFLSSRNELKSNLIMQWLQNIQPGANDTLMIYYSGHGGMDLNRRTFLALQGEMLFRSKLSDAIENAKKCRLKMLITDCCSDGPTRPEAVSKEMPRIESLRNLFLEHEGFLHITGASEGEYSWSSQKYGGWFTRSLIEYAINPATDADQNGFVTWEEVLSLVITKVQKKFEQTKPYFSSQQLRDMTNKGITSQTPKAYSYPKRVTATKIITETVQPPPPEPSENLKTLKVTTPSAPETLWSISNPSSSFSVFIDAEKPQFDIGSNLSLRIKSTADCYIILVNWNTNGDSIQLFPNKYESNSFMAGGKEYRFPSSEAGFDLRVSGPKSEEKFKIFAIRNRSDTLKIRSLIPMDDGSGGSIFSRVAVVPKKTTSGNTVEAMILDAIRKLRQSDWAEAKCTIQIR